MDIAGSTNGIKTSLLTGMAANFRSGNLVLDMLVVTIFSSVIGLIFSAIPSLLQEKLPALLQWLTSKTMANENVVVIKHSSIFNDRYGEWVSAEDESLNTHLIEAIQDQLVKDKVEVDEQLVSLSQHSKKSGNQFESMQTRSILATPTSTVKYRDMTLDFEKSQAQVGEGQSSKSERTVVLTLTTIKPPQYLRDFIEECYDNYVDEHYKKYDSKTKLLYYYVPESEPSKDRGAFVVYNRYLLKNGKTFDGAFFPEKKDTVNLIQRFVDKGKEQNNKLSFLLYGTPGCGKTTFIKALANMTQRSVVNVRLGSIRTNEELLNVFHQVTVSYNEVSNGSKYVTSSSLELHERIYIMEDVDADAEDIVKRREQDSSKKIYAKDFEAAAEDDGDDDDGDDAVFDEASAREKMKKLSGGGGGSGSSGGKDGLSPAITKLLGPSDPVNLSGLLNVLDGLLELPGAIIVMTTNHPEKLDPALIRPGRITKKIYFGMMQRPEMLQMLEFYFEDELKENRAKVMTLMKGIVGGLCTPAAIEACLQTSTCVADAVQKVSEIEQVALEKQKRLQRKKETDKLRASLVADDAREPININLRISTDQAAAASRRATSSVLSPVLSPVLDH